jgi:hypothetical protein
MFNHPRAAQTGGLTVRPAHHVRFEPGVERIEFDGPFATGPTGRTVAARLATELDRLVGGVPYSGQTSTAGSMSTQAENEQATKQPADRSSTEWRASGRTASGATANTVDLPLATRSA